MWINCITTDKPGMAGNTASVTTNTTAFTTFNITTTTTEETVNAGVHNGRTERQIRRGKVSLFILEEQEW